MIDASEPNKALLIELTKYMLEGMGEGVAHEDALTKLREFIDSNNPKTGWSGDLSLADFGDVLVNEIMAATARCTCSSYWLDQNAGAHHPDCDMWDPKAG